MSCHHMKQVPFSLLPMKVKLALVYLSQTMEAWNTCQLHLKKQKTWQWSHQDWRTPFHQLLILLSRSLIALSNCKCVYVCKYIFVIIIFPIFWFQVLVAFDTCDAELFTHLVEIFGMLHVQCVHHWNCRLKQIMFS